jgi:hypothetical protein
MSHSSTSDNSEWRLDELAAAARLRAIYGMELRPMPPTPLELAAASALDRIEE